MHQQARRLFLRATARICGPRFCLAAFRLLSQLTSAPDVLRQLGARVGNQCHIPSSILVYNAPRASLQNLTIGSQVYVGPRALLDLTAPITLEDCVTVSAQVSFITHIDTGYTHTKRLYPRKEGPITLRQGCWIGVNSTILHNVTIGEDVMIGAMSLVTESIPSGKIAFGIPCKVKRDTFPARSPST